MNYFEQTGTVTLKGGLEIELVGRDGHFMGFGAIHQGADLLRDGSRPMFVEIRNPSAVSLTNYRLVERYEEGDAHVLRLSADRIEAGMMEWMLHTVRNRFRASDWTDLPVEANDTSLEVVLRPAGRNWKGETFRGFSYQYRYASESIPIYKILDRGTWEPGGSVLGSEFWLRNGVVPSIMGFNTEDQRYSTEWYLPPIEQPNIFQFFPFQVQMQGFTYTASSAGTLVTWATQPAHIRSLFEKHAGKSALFHWHEHCADLSHQFETSPMEVLWHPTTSNGRVETLNRYEAVREFVWDELHRQVGMRYEVIEPYGVIEEWTVPDMNQYRDDAAPKLLAAGAKTIFIPNEFENNMNVWGLSNMCCNVDFKVADSVGKDAFRSFCKVVNDGGGKVEMWGNTALSSLADMFRRKNGSEKRIDFLPTEGSISEVLDQAKHPWIRNASGAIEADHYTPVFCALNLRDNAIRDYWMKSWKELHDEFGVGQIFIDSSFNMSADKFTHRQNDDRERAGGATLDQADLLGMSRPLHEPRQAIQSQYHAYLDVLVAMQKDGYVICGEDVGLFGLSRSGPDIAMRVDSLPLWMDSYCDFDPSSLGLNDADAQELFLRGLAYRVMWKIYYDVPSRELTFRLGGAKHGADRPMDWHRDALRAYCKALPYMKRRTVTANENSVRYDSDEGSAFWSLRPSEVAFDQTKRILNLMDGGEVVADRASLKARQVYLVLPVAI